jgi:hypothetical protein
MIAVGPAMPGWGSWDWVGVDVLTELRKYFPTCAFADGSLPESDLLLLVKQVAPVLAACEGTGKPPLIYCPVDFFGSAAEIDACAAALRRCARVVIHCERLRRYFEPYAPVEYMDHHVKFDAPMRSEFQREGYLLWVGVRTNLPPFIEWVNRNPVPGELVVLTNLEDPSRLPSPTELGFAPGLPVRIEQWSKERQIELTAGAKAALDIKGQDFRSRHKPPAKAMDFIASGVPLAMNSDSCVVEHLARMGFEVASPLDTERWFSRAYWEETCRFGAALRELLSLRRIGLRFKRIIEEVLAERR